MHDKSGEVHASYATTNTEKHTFGGSIWGWFTFEPKMSFPECEHDAEFEGLELLTSLPTS